MVLKEIQKIIFEPLPLFFIGGYGIHLYLFHITINRTVLKTIYFNNLNVRSRVYTFTYMVEDLQCVPH